MDNGQTPSLFPSLPLPLTSLPLQPFHEEVTGCARMVASVSGLGVQLGNLKPGIPSVYAVEQHAPMLLAFLQYRPRASSSFFYADVLFHCHQHILED
eukprot:2763348-Prorocentrum_lima.AAC.1